MYREDFASPFASLLWVVNMSVRKAIRVNLSLSNSDSDWGVLVSKLNMFVICLSTHRTSDTMVMKTRWKMNCCYQPNNKLSYNDNCWKSAHRCIFLSIQLFISCLYIHMQTFFTPIYTCSAFFKACTWFRAIQFHAEQISVKFWGIITCLIFL